MNDIVRPLNEAKDLGYDQFGQLMAIKPHPYGSGTVMTMVPDLRGKTCPICGRGWELDGASFWENARLEATGRHVHTRCMNGYLSAEEASFWSGTLCDISPDRPPFDGLKVIPNEYRGSWDTDWYLVDTFETRSGLGGADWDAPRKPYKAKLKVGSRKRVYHMELFDLSPEQVTFLKGALGREEVTQYHEASSFIIHAWTRAKAKEYLAAFVKAILMEKPQ